MTAYKLLLLLGVLASVYCSPLDDVSRKMMQTIDPTPIIMNKEMVNKFMECFFDTGPCNPIAAQVKKSIGEVLESGCSDCPEEQIILIRSVLKAFVPRYPDQWKKFLDKYDPEGKYWPALKQKLQLDGDI